MKILVTGANGQVGFCLAQQLANTVWDYLALTREELDITDLCAVEKLVDSYKPNIIINAAAYTAVDKAESDVDAANAINYIGAGNLAQAANAVGAAIFQISTDYVFAGDALSPYSEDDAVAPQGVYGLSKLKGEHLVVASNPHHIVLRTAWVFGEHGNNFVKTMIRLGRDREQLGIVADQLGAPTYAGDIAKTLLKLVQKYEDENALVWGVYHYSGSPQVSWYEFAQEIFLEVSAQDLYTKPMPTLKPIATTDYPTPAKRPVNSRLNCEKIQQEFGAELSDWKLALKNIKAYA